VGSIGKSCKFKLQKVMYELSADVYAPISINPSTRGGGEVSGFHLSFKYKYGLNKGLGLGFSV
jgi:hypothetical protein